MRKTPKNQQIKKEKKESPKRPVSASKPSHYIDKNDLLQEIIVCQKNKQASEKLVLMFDKIIEGVAHRFANLQYYGIYEDVKQDCHLLLLQKYNNFKVRKKTSCFAYFTTIIYNQMRYQLSRVRKQKEKRDFMISQVSDYVDSHRDYFCDEDDNE